jgi:predicted nucleotidyltransferase
MDAQVQIAAEEIASLCQRWHVAELSLFGSVLRQDFGPASDVDVLVRFQPNDTWSLLDFVRMKAELEAIFARPVDLVEQDAIRNPFRRKAILGSKQVIYAA